MVGSSGARRRSATWCSAAGAWAATGRAGCSARAARRGWRSGPRPAWPTPVPPGLVAPWAATSYDGAVRAMVVGHKEDRCSRWPDGSATSSPWPSARPLVDAGAADAPVLLVPVPSRPSSTRRRGYEPTAALTRRGRGPAHGVRRRGRVRAAAPHPARAADQAGLDAAGRAANLSGPSGAPSRAASPGPADRHGPGRSGPRRGVRRRADDRGDGAEAQRALRGRRAGSTGGGRRGGDPATRGAAGGE